MDVKYIPADWEKMRAGLSDLLGHGFGKGVFDHLKDVNEVLEDAERDIAKYDVDGAIPFHHTSQKSLYNSLSDDFSVLHRFTGKVGDIVDRTIDEPFYKDMDSFVQAVRDLSISNYSTGNRIGAKETVQYGYGAGTTITEVPKTEVGIDDLLSGGNFYADQMKQQFEEWKVANPDEEISEDKYRMAAVNSRAFEYESIRDKQENKEFWAGIVSLVVIVGVSLVCPPAGIALGAAYGVMELSSAVSGKDWVSGRELSTSERWTRGLLAPLDIIPATAAVSKFAKGARVAQLGGHVGKLDEGITAGSSIRTGIKRVKQLVNSAANFATTRLRNAANALNDAKNVTVNKVARDLVDVGKAVDTSATWIRNNLNLGRLAATPDGTLVRMKKTAENTHKVETNLKDFLSRFEGINLRSEGTGNGNTLNLEDITNEILNTKPMNSPNPDKWYKKGGGISIDDNGTWTYTNKSGVSVSYPNGYPDFTPYMHPNVKSIQIEVHSPKNNPKDFENANIAAQLTKDTDPPIIDIRRPPEGYTWHHHEDGKTMMLVDEDIHREFRHIGGQSKINGKNKL